MLIIAQKPNYYSLSKVIVTYCIFSSLKCQMSSYIPAASAAALLSELGPLAEHHKAGSILPAGLDWYKQSHFIQLYVNSINK